MVNKRFLWMFVIISLGIVILDQIVKYLFLKFSFDVDLGVVWFHLIFNTGAGFGILKNYTIILAIISLIAALLIILNYKKIPKNKFPQVFFAVLLGGVIGNLIDRAFRGFVVDYLDFKFWPAFNLADACITVSIIGLVIWYWKKDKN